VENGQIHEEVKGLETLDGVIRWALARSPRAEFLDVVVQDEYTHDVIVRADSCVYVVFDTT
jgi:hypothetical protein